MKIASVQIESNIFDLEGNFLKHKNIIENTSLEESVDIFCFPEASLTGYSVELGEKIALTTEIRKKYITKFEKLSNDFNCLILVGMIEKDDDKYYISHYSISKESIHKYRKIHLGKKESLLFTEGSEVNVFSYEGINYGIQLCYDLHFPELSTIQKIKGADIIFAPHAVSKKSGDRKKIWEKYVLARAYDNSVFLVCCNQVSNQEKEFGGAILIVSQNGEVLKEFYEDKEKILVFRYTKDDIKSSKKNFFSNRKPKYYREILGGI